MATAAAREPAEPRRAGSIDPRTGAIRFDDWDTVLRPSLTYRAFLDSALGRAAKPVLGNDIVLYFNLPTCHIAGRKFHGTMAFWTKTHRPDFVMLHLVDRGLGVGMSDEAARHEAHTSWLRAHMADDYWSGAQLRETTERVAPSKRTFRWGSISAGFDPHDDYSAIVIGYRGPKPPARKSRNRSGHDARSIRHPPRRSRSRPAHHT